jgi:hypothetical protein
VDEATVIPEVFWKQLLGRLSVPVPSCSPRRIQTTPAHWLKKDYLDKLKLPVGHPNRPDGASFDFEPSLTSDEHRRGLGMHST